MTPGPSSGKSSSYRPVPRLLSQRELVRDAWLERLHYFLFTSSGCVTVVFCTLMFFGLFLYFTN